MTVCGGVDARVLFLQYAAFLGMLLTKDSIFEKFLPYLFLENCMTKEKLWENVWSWDF